MIIFSSNGYKIKIDAEDFEKANRGRSLFVREDLQVVISRRVKGVSRHVRLHREIMNAPKNLHVDHINGDRLDNRKSNLRLCTIAENNRNNPARRGKTKNPHGYKGVFRDKRVRKNGVSLGTLGARICVNGKIFSKLGFKTELEAARAYDELAKIHHGEFARLNFPAET